MKKLKLKQAVVVSLATIGLLAGQVYAAQAQVENLPAQPVATFSEAEVNALFIKALFDHNADQPMQLAALSQQEMMETEGAAWPKFIVKGLSPAGRAIGPAGAWVRFGNSYSKTGRINTVAVRWGSNAHHRNSIGNESLRNFNAQLRNTRIPINNWRTNDPGHFHLWRR